MFFNVYFLFIDFFNVRDLLLVIDVLFVLKGKVKVDEMCIYNNYDDTDVIKIMIVVIVLIILHYIIKLLITLL